MSRHYLLALSLIGGLAIISAVLIGVLVERQESYATIIDMAGRQRMLSLRIAALVAPGGVEDPAALTQAADEMLQAHWTLRQEPAHMTLALTQSYFAPATGLDQRVQGFLRTAASLASGPVNPAVARRVRQEAMGPLLDSLQNTVELHQAAAERDMSVILWGHCASAALALLLLLAETMLIFRPQAHRLAGLTERLAREADHDPLTGLYNRRAMERVLEAALVAGERLAIIMLDLDYFKGTNDSAGHAAGDAVLCAAAERLRAALAPGDIVARVGGDEFLILLRGITDRAKVQAMAEGISERLGRPFTWQGQALRIGATCGFAMSPADACVRSDLLRVADDALRRAKAAARGRVAGASAADATRLAREAQIATALFAAGGAPRGLYAALQPQIDLKDGALLGFEALARWDDPVLGAIAPGEFLPIAARQGLLPALGRAVRRDAFSTLAWLRDAGLPAPRVAINLAPEELAVPNLVEAIELDLITRGLRHADLELEITEDVLLDRVSDVVRERLKRLRDRGVRLSIDDFGTGYAGLLQLLRLSLDAVKLDRRFVAGIGYDARAEEIIRATAGLAAGLGLELVAEGVETEQQAQILLERGITIGQGWLLARPMRQAELWDWLEARSAKAPMVLHRLG
ncbi:diguanylate cyclase (GGDEF)-like protein [Humitalea rosea]|uniref:Diguanylate cyclase (GGDEF)-like protein n=1 Tax=Humitalea rosea TaxID=990373 RepID=A0A2W7JBG8_9PROT|nr:bifunctional diguanylate cyclase/phosphodiesterase [Humitalea rosea]PZW49031.1 diguanylate cyclase (GGDEF)-like protein [Humitalea rosea]